MTENRAPAEIISIASGKGGTGKTLLLASLAYALRRAGHQVLVVDFDLATEGLSHFVLGDDGVRRIAEFRTENTVSGFIQNFETDIGTVPLLEPRTINRGTDQEIIYEAVISGRGLYGDIADAVEAKDTAQKGTDDNTRAAVKAIFERLRPMPYDYILIDTRGGFSLLTTYVCALSHSYILVTEPTTASLYQNRKLQDRILDEAEQDKLRPVLRGAIVNKAVRDVEPKLDNDGQLVFDADEIERRFRGDLAQELGTEVHNTYGIPSDLAAVETYAFQRIPFSHARGSLFSLTTIDAFSGLMGTVTVEWDVKRLNMWNSLVKEMRAATVKAYADAAAEFENQVTSRASDKSQAALVRQSHEHAQKRRNAVIQTGIASLIVGWVVLLFALSAGLLPASTTQIINNWTGGRPMRTRTLAIFGTGCAAAMVSFASAQSLAESGAVTLPFPIVSGEPISASGLNANFAFLLDRIQQLESDLQDFQSFFDDRANELTDFLAATQRATFRGAVVAFNRSEKTDGDVCPPGWRPFEPAGGRFIVGAGLHRNQDANGTLLDSYPSYAGDPEAAVGGEASGRLVASDVFETDPKFIAKHSLTGANIPPYVALYYCWFDG